VKSEISQVRNFVSHGIRIGLDYAVKILDWIGNANIFDPFNIRRLSFSVSNLAAFP